MNTKDKDHVEKSGEGFASKVIDEIKSTAKSTFVVIGVGATLAASVLGISSAGMADSISASAQASNSVNTAYSILNDGNSVYQLDPDYPDFPGRKLAFSQPPIIEIPDYGRANPEAKFINPPIYYNLPIVSGKNVPVAFKSFNENAPEWLYNFKIEGAAYLPLYNNGNMQFFQFGTVDVVFSKRENNGKLKATDFEQFTFLAPVNSVTSINGVLLIEEAIPMHTTASTINFGVGTFKDGTTKFDAELQELATYQISAAEQDGAIKSILLLRNEPVDLISKNNNSDWASYIRK